MPLHPVELNLEIKPGARFDLIDVRQQAAAHQSTLESFPQALYCSFHTTAGYLDQSLASRLNHQRLGIGPYMNLFQALFPEGAGYRHDDLHLREELSDVQRVVEPRNADAHLAFIAAGLRNCVKYVNRRNEQVYFVDLDGINGDQPRKRQTSILAFNVEQVVVRDQIRVPVSRHPLESVNLKDPRLGLYERLHELIARHGVAKGRVHLSLATGEHQAGLTINEYETLLMRHDLIEVLRNPLRFMAEKGRHLLENPWAIPNKTIGYAKYDLVRVLNETFDALHMNESLMEKALARLIGAPARRFLRMKRSVSLLVSDREISERGTIADGTYQSPILVQWRNAVGRQRLIDVTLTRLA
jgi:thiamine phosphate synthase YjbQ (UPF0047 family)